MKAGLWLGTALGSVVLAPKAKSLRGTIGTVMLGEPDGMARLTEMGARATLLYGGCTFVSDGVSVEVRHPIPD